MDYMGDTVQQIKDKLNIIDVVSAYVELHKAGKNFKGKSPFSSEKTPSFYVSPDRGMYYCFSTSQGGDIFTFVQAMEGVDFKEALRILAEKAGVELVPENPHVRSERDRYYEALSSATKFFIQKLKSEPEAMAYLTKRGVEMETLVAWQIGYAPGPPRHGWREVKNRLESEGFSVAEMLKTGLIKPAEGGKEPFDVFRDRIMFPMADPSGKIVAFSGRILHPDERSPKYVNSPETELYKKSELLFGFDKAKQGIRRLGFSLIVEGQFDVIMCHQIGYDNTVAVSGTALTVQHVQLLERLSKKVVLALDADRAGISAMKKVASIMLGRGLDVKVAELPLGHDPADVISSDPAGFKKVVGGSVPVIEFLVHALRQETKDDRAFKLKAREEILPFILLLSNRIDQEYFVEKTADMIGTTKEAVRYELERLREQTRLSKLEKTAVVDVAKSNNGKQMAVKAEFSQLAQHQLFLEAVVSLIDEPLLSLVRKTLMEFLDTEEKSVISESELNGTIFMLEQQFANLPKLAIQDEVLGRLNHFRSGILRRRLAHWRGILTQDEVVTDEARLVDILSRISQIERELREPPCTLG